MIMYENESSPMSYTVNEWPLIQVLGFPLE